MSIVKELLTNEHSDIDFNLIKTIQQIYFAHAIVDYNTEYENLCINTINSHYKDCKIINPKDLKIDKEIPEAGRFNLYFYPTILKCDILFAAPAMNHKTKNFKTGTTKEMIFAIKNNISVVALIDNEIKEINKDFFHEIVWDVYG